MPTSSTGKPAALLQAGDCGHLRAPEQSGQPCPACSGCWPASSLFFATLGAYASHREQELQ